MFYICFRNRIRFAKKLKAYSDIIFYARSQNIGIYYPMGHFKEIL